MKFAVMFSACVLVCAIGAPAKCFADELWNGPGGSSILLSPGWRSGPVITRESGAYSVDFSGSRGNSCTLIRTPPPRTASQSQQVLNELSAPNYAISSWRELLAPLQRILTNLNVSVSDLSSEWVGGVRRSRITTYFRGGAGASITLDGVFVKRPNSFEYFFCWGTESGFSTMVTSYRTTL